MTRRSSHSLAIAATAPLLSATVGSAQALRPRGLGAGFWR